jgi:hypothetical protein
VMYSTSHYATCGQCRNKLGVEAGMYWSVSWPEWDWYEVPLQMVTYTRNRITQEWTNSHIKRGLVF